MNEALELKQYCSATFSDITQAFDVVCHTGLMHLHLDRRFAWHKHIFIKWKQLGIILTKMYGLLIYKTIFKLTCTYEIQLWGTTSNIEILVSFQSKVLRIITDAPWYVPNTIMQKGLQIPKD
jgi:hypothetical protein